MEGVTAYDHGSECHAGNISGERGLIIFFYYMFDHIPVSTIERP